MIECALANAMQPKIANNLDSIPDILPNRSSADLLGVVQMVQVFVRSISSAADDFETGYIRRHASLQ